MTRFHTSLHTSLLAAGTLASTIGSQAYAQEKAPVPEASAATAPADTQQAAAPVPLTEEPPAARPSTLRGGGRIAHQPA